MRGMWNTLLLLGLLIQADRQFAPGAVEREVRENILNQPVGTGVVRDDAFPADYVWRCVDRVVRSSFQERYRSVVSVPGTVPQPDPQSVPADADSGPTPGAGRSSASPTGGGRGWLSRLAVAGSLGLGGFVVMLAWTLWKRGRS